MTFEEREQLNNYHQLVYKRISPYLPEAEKRMVKALYQSCITQKAEK